MSLKLLSGESFPHPAWLKDKENLFDELTALKNQINYPIVAHGSISKLTEGNEFGRTENDQLISLEANRKMTERSDGVVRLFLEEESRSCSQFIIQ